VQIHHVFRYYFTSIMKKNQEASPLVIENVYSENDVIDRWKLDQDEQLPLIDNESNQDSDNLKSISFDHLPWHKRPSVSFLPLPRMVLVLMS